MCRRRAVRALWTLCVVLAACSGGSTASDDGIGPPSSPVSGRLEVGAVTAEVNAGNPLSAVIRLTTSVPARVSAVLDSDLGHRVVVPSSQVATDHALPVLGLRADSRYTVSVEVTAAEPGARAEVGTSLTTEPLPDDFPLLTVEVSDPERMAPGFTLLNLTERGTGFEGAADRSDVEVADGTGFIAALDADGEVVWYHRSGGSFSDVSVTPWGTILAVMGQHGVVEIDPLGNTVRSWAGTTAFAVDSPDGRALHEDGAVELATDTIHHDAHVLPNGNIVALSTELVEVGGWDRDPCPPEPGADAEPFSGLLPVVADVVVEFDPDSGEIVREFRLADLLDPHTQRGTVFCDPVPFPTWYPDQPAAADWTHANAVELWPAQNALLVSVRHLDSIVALRYDDDSDGPAGEILWQLGPGGDFELAGDGSEEWFRAQHAPEVIGGDRVIVYDNGNHRPGTTLVDGGTEAPYSRAVIYQLDLTPGRRTATQLWEHVAVNTEGAPLYADFLGDADVLDGGNVLIAHGGELVLDSVDGETVVRVRAQLFEVVPEGADGGATVFELLVQESRKGWFIYRAERIASLDRFGAGP